MAMFTDPHFDQASSRHELHFVNQQFDFLMCICWNEAAQDYAFNVPEEDVLRIAKLWRDAPFNVKEYLDRARKELPEMDRKPPKV